MTAPRNPSNRRGRQVSEAEFRRMWTDPKLTGRDVARALGITDNAAISRARYRGLQPQGQAKAHRLQMIVPPEREAEFKRLWLGGVSYAEMAEHFGCNTVSIWRVAKRLRMPSRMRGKAAVPLMAVLMAQTAQAETAAAQAHWRREA